MHQPRAVTASPVMRPNALVASFCHRQCTTNLDRGHNNFNIFIRKITETTVTQITVVNNNNNRNNNIRTEVTNEGRTKKIILTDLEWIVRALTLPKCSRQLSFISTSIRPLPIMGNSVRQVSRHLIFHITQSHRAWILTTTTFNITTNNNHNSFNKTGQNKNCKVLFGFKRLVRNKTKIFVSWFGFFAISIWQLFTFLDWKCYNHYFYSFVLKTIYIIVIKLNFYES